MSSLEQTLQNNGWQFVEVWVDTTAFPPYILMLLNSKTGNFYIYDPASGYKIVFSSSNYEEAKLWLLEDEYEKIEGRIQAEGNTQSLL